MITLNIGSVLHGERATYRIEKVLGHGSFGITYMAKAFTVRKGAYGQELVEVSRPKAIKEFFMKEINGRDQSGSVTSISVGSLSYHYALQFQKEAKNLFGMNHPNIVKAIDFIRQNNTFYYVMDYVEGENLNDYIKTHQVSEREAENMIREVVKALLYMHDVKHILHLDLKPGNIMRRASDGHIFLIDFGLSKHFSEDGQPETSTTVGVGTPGYAPIEQANQKASHLFRPTLDVYALGATLFKLLTGQTPPTADVMLADAGLLDAEMQKRGVSQKLRKVVAHAMKLNPNVRTQNVRQFLAELNVSDNLLQPKKCVVRIEGVNNPALIHNISISVRNQPVTIQTDGTFFLAPQDAMKPQNIFPSYKGNDYYVNSYALDAQGILHVRLSPRSNFEKKANNNHKRFSFKRFCWRVLASLVAIFNAVLLLSMTAFMIMAMSKGKLDVAVFIFALVLSAVFVIYTLKANKSFKWYKNVYIIGQIVLLVFFGAAVGSASEIDADSAFMFPPIIAAGASAVIAFFKRWW